MADIYLKLHDDHREMRSKLQALRGMSSARQCRECLVHLGILLVTHARAEEKVFYAALLRKGLDANPVEADRTYEEHRDLEELYSKTWLHFKEDAEWDGHLDLLSESLNAHVDFEEQELFSLARQVFSAEEAETLGHFFEVAKEKYRKTLPEQSRIDARHELKSQLETLRSIA